MFNKYAYVMLIDENSFLGSCVTLSGIIKNCKLNFDIVVFYWSLCNERKEQLKKMYSNIIFKKVDNEDYLLCNFSTFPRAWGYNCAYRFEIFTLKNYERIIYIDCDFLVQNNLSVLFKKDIDFGAVKAEADCMPQGNKRFNAGLLVIGKKYLNINVKKELIKLCMGPAPIFNNSQQWISDEPILNTYFKDITYIKKKFNYLVTTLEVDNIDNNNYHFNGDRKPYNALSFQDSYNECFLKYFLEKNGMKGVLFLKKLFSIYNNILQDIKKIII